MTPSPLAPAEPGLPVVPGGGGPVGPVWERAEWVPWWVVLSPDFGARWS